MKVRAFVQSVGDQPSTLEELVRVHQWANTTAFLGLFAYATQSGTATFDFAMGEEFWKIPTRWLFGIDYGRTHPQALRFMLKKASAEVRIHDGAWVVENDGFLPRRDFHMKMSFLFNQETHRFGMVVGSGNFSSNGLRQGAEAGATFRAGGQEEFRRTFGSAFKSAESLWNAAVPASQIIDRYEERWSAPTGPIADDLADPDYQGIHTFWIEAGYVTRNRGEYRPGNQIDMPRGMNRYFGFNAPTNMPKNTVIGSVTFEPPSGMRVTRNLRLGNNLMEKITLPIPEEHGLDMYDGKVLVFYRRNGVFRMVAMEVADFDTAYGQKLAAVRLMDSGRRYGYVK